MSVPRLAVLLPPSEGKAPGGRRRPWDPASGRFGESLSPQRRLVAEALATAGGGSAALLGATGALLERARGANVSLVGAPTLPAAHRYTGVVWEALDLGSASESVRRRATTSGAGVCTRRGAVALDDRVPDYRLKMGASLAPLGKLSTWWREPLSRALADWSKGRDVVDLLTNDLRAAWVPPARTRGVRVQFVERHGGGEGNGSGGAVGHDAKAAKGRLARHLLESTDDPLAALRAWHHDRFVLVLTPLG